MKQDILKKLEKNESISGEILAREFNVSRTAIWKNIQLLKKDGYVIKSKKNKGYSLISKPDTPFPEELKKGLKTQIIGKKIYYLPAIDSTNKYAKELIKNEMVDGTVIISDIQTSGRGRKNRSWSSPFGGLWFSVILKPNLPPNEGMLLTMAFSISIANAIKDITGLTPVIKWPNDLLINNKKICGILTELDAELDGINYCIIGVGINVNNDIDDSLKNTATSIRNELHSNTSRVDLLKSILNNLDVFYQKISIRDLNSIRKPWLRFSNIIGRSILVKGEKEIMQGIVTDIDETGCILLKTERGIQRILSGDIEYI